MNKIISLNKKYNILTIILFILTSMFMYNAYKALSGFIANGFRDGLAMLSIVICYFIPVISFLFYFYDNHIKKINKIVSLIYSLLIIGLSIFTFIQIMIFINIYIPNNKLGAYETLLSFSFGFPYDGIIILIILLLTQAYNIFLYIKPNTKYNIKKLINNYNIKSNFIEYLLLSILAILTFVFVGAFLIGFKAISNIFYDIKYIYLLLLVLLPLMNLLCLLLKPESKSIKSLIIPLAINIIFGLLMLIFELIDPSFMVNIGKPLFPITFSISIPIECFVLLLIMGISSLIYLAKIIYYTLKRHN